MADNDTDHLATVARKVDPAAERTIKLTVNVANEGDAGQEGTA
jgi:hypothetical protein